MEVAKLQKNLVDYKASLFQEEVLNDQYNQLVQLEDESSPGFVVEVVTLFFQDTEKILTELAKSLNQQSVDFKKVDAYVHQLKGSSSSIGAQRVHRGCVAFRNYCQIQNTEGCFKSLQVMTHEYSSVKNKLQTLFKLEKQLEAAGGSPPM